MSEKEMPAAEVAQPERDDERTAYEFAFHVLPTVAEGEVSSVFGELKSLITNHSGEIFDEEAPQRFDLAYDIVKHIEGKNRKFSSAYFGWVRFRLEPGELATLTEEIEADKRLLRYLTVKLTRQEEEQPFYFHEAMAAAQVTDVEEQEVVQSEGESAETAEASAPKEDEPVEEAAESAETTTSGTDTDATAPEAEAEKSA